MTPQGLVAALDLQVPIFGLGNTCMDGFLIFLAQMIPYEYDRLLEYADLKYLHVCANSGTLLGKYNGNPSKCYTLPSFG